MISRTSPATGGRWAAGAALLLSVTGCILEEPPAEDDAALEVRDLSVRVVDWNPEAIPVGHVRAVVERGSTTVVLGDAGATLFSGGVWDGTDAAAAGIQSAAVIPAADRDGLWIAGTDEDGDVRRLVAGQSFEVVSSLYGLSADHVSGLAALGDTGAVFAVEDGLAISEGALVTRYDTGTLSGVTGGGGRVAGVTEQGVSLVVPGIVAAPAALSTFELPGAKAVAFDGEGRLLALTPEAIYREDVAGALAVIYTAEARLSGLAATPERVWFADGTRLGIVDEAGVALSPEDALPGRLALTGSPSGDVWVMAGGALSRFEIDVDAESSRAAWEEDIQPIFQASCTPCHEPGGSAGAPLSTHDAWEARREELRERVLQKMDMPPPGFELSDDDREAIGAWLEPR